MNRLIWSSIICMLSSQMMPAQPGSPGNHKADSLIIHGSIALTKIGAAPIPVPPVYSPFLSVGASLSYGRWSYEPLVNLQLNGKPWIIDNWLRYRLFESKKWRLIAGINPFMYYPAIPPAKQPANHNPNLSAGLSAAYSFSGRWTLGIDYRFDRGFEGAVLTGHFICLSLSMMQDLPAKHYLRWNAHLVCFDYPGQLHGLFGSTDIFLGSRQWRGSIFFQALQPLVCREGPVPFIWNAGISYAW